MKKLIISIIMMIIVLTGCGTTYEESQPEGKNDDYYGGGYFVTIREWGTTPSDSTHYAIIYAKDTKVKYLLMKSTYKAGITPLYNADGSLQIYKEGEEEK